MYTTVTKYDFHDAFRDWHGGMYRNNFSYEGRELLFDWLEEIEEQGGAGIEFDVVALCCDYSEETPEEICQNYDLDPEGVLNNILVGRAFTVDSLITLL